VLRLPLVTFGVLAPLALVGIALTLSDWRRLLPLHLVILASFATAVLFIALSRYRMPAVPVLAVFAAFALVSAFRFSRARDVRRLALVTGLALLATFAVNWRVPREDLSMAYFNLGNAYSEVGRYEHAVAAYMTALDSAPNYLSTWNNLAVAYEESGRTGARGADLVAAAHAARKQARPGTRAAPSTLRALNAR
jgi:tetratricopeptide (TPR) repeat protein